jgi:LmbE family N-acetylglucosaminyl deacetylase
MRRSRLLRDLSGRTILCVGAHADDIEIGCGGTLRRMLREQRDLGIYWVVLSAEGVREKEARASAEDHLSAAARGEIVTRQFRDGFFPYEGAKIKELFEELKGSCSPEVIFSHSTADLHQDHRLVAELTWNTFRDHLILEYEVPKYDGGLGSPNVFVHLEEADMQRKLETLRKFFPSQHQKPWFSSETFTSLARLRAVECKAATGLAEAFYAKKISV